LLQLLLDITKDSGGEKSLNHATEGILFFPTVFDVSVKDFFSPLTTTSCLKLNNVVDLYQN